MVRFNLPTTQKKAIKMTQKQLQISQLRDVSESLLPKDNLFQKKLVFLKFVRFINRHELYSSYSMPSPSLIDILT